MKIQRPGTLKEVAVWSKSIQEFGMNLRDWQHEIQRGGVHSKSEFSKRISEAPPFLAQRFSEGKIADAYLAAYAEWLADQAGISRPPWCSNKKRITEDPWFSAPSHRLLLVQSPASFRQRNLFTIPERVFTPKAGRPPVPSDQKREKARLRQKAYRTRIRELVQKARTLSSDEGK